MVKEILINVEPYEKRVAIVNNGILEEFYIERPQDKSIVGNIYKGKIENVVSGIGAAFVNIGLEQNGFLYLSEIEDLFESEERPELYPLEIKKGDEVLVQVVKEPYGTKGPRLTTQIGLPGRYLVLTPQNANIGVSRRIEDEAERRRLREIISNFRIPKGMGFIVRTAAWGVPAKALFYDAKFLLKLWKRLNRLIRRNPAPWLIYEEYDLVLRVVRDSFTEDVDRLIVDSKVEFYRIRKFLKTFLNHLSNRVILYKGTNLFKEKDIERQINKIFEPKVYLKSKAYIVIEPTEGLVVIDVNSGGFNAKNLSQEEMAFRINSEAAEEIARQLRLRDLGGIIVIDFIDMQKEFSRQKVLQVLKRALSKDRAKYDILGISRFGLVEMTRERIHKTLQMITYENCPYCGGKGKVKSALTMSIYLLRELRNFLQENPSIKKVEVILNQSIYEEINKNIEVINQLKRKFNVEIIFKPSPNLHIEEIKILAKSEKEFFA